VQNATALLQHNLHCCSGDGGNDDDDDNDDETKDKQV
jgi:hypothetical protein